MLQRVDPSQVVVQLNRVSYMICSRKMASRLGVIGTLDVSRVTWLNNSGNLLQA